MNWRTFMFYNAAGGIAWATLMGTLGYLAGKYFQNHFDQVLHLVHVLGWAGLGIAALTLVGGIIFFKWRIRNRPQSSNEKKEQEPEYVEVS